MSKKRIIIKIIIVAVLYGFYGIFDTVLAVTNIIGINEIQKNYDLEIESWVYDLIYFLWLYDYLLVLGLLIAVFFKYDLAEPFRKLIKKEIK